MIKLSCADSDLTNVAVTGPCNSPFDGEGGYIYDAVYVNGEKAGTCHVVLTFATGFAYAVDVTFAAETSWVCGSPNCGSCGEITGPTGGPFTASNPSSTCGPLDAGARE